MTEPASAQAPESLGELTARARRATQQLIAQEKELAMMELRVEGRKVGLGAVLLVGAGLIGYLGLLMVIVAASFALTYVGGGTPLDVGFIATGITFLVTAGLAGMGGLLVARKLSGPRLTMRTLSDDLRWARHPTVAPNSELEALKATHTFPKR